MLIFIVYFELKEIISGNIMKFFGCEIEIDKLNM